MYNECYRQLDWPSLPDDLVTNLIQYAKDADCIGGSKAMFNNVFGAIKPTDELLEWIKCIPELDGYFIGLQRFTNIETVPTHVDSIRDYSFNCVLTSSVPYTIFYEDNKVLDKVQYQTNRWYYHNSSIPHKVTNMNNQIRVAVTAFIINDAKVGPSYALSDQAIAFARD